MKTYLKITPLLPLLFLVACSTGYNVQVDALKRDNWSMAGGDSYRLVSKTPGIETGDLYFQEVSHYVAAALSKKGYELATDSETADLEIRVNAYLSDPMTATETRSEPVFYDSAGRTRVIATPVLNKQGQVVRYIYSEYWTGPRRELAGYYDRDRQITVYDKILVLEAYEVADSGEAEDQVWTVKMRMRDESTDLRNYLPYLLSASMPYIGSRTKGEITVEVKKDNPDAISLDDRASRRMP